MRAMDRSHEMRLSRILLLILTPIGVAIGLYEAWHLAGRRMFFLMALQVLLLTAAILVLVRIARREARRQSRRD